MIAKAGMKSRQKDQGPIAPTGYELFVEQVLGSYVSLCADNRFGVDIPPNEYH